MHGFYGQGHIPGMLQPYVRPRRDDHVLNSEILVQPAVDLEAEMLPCGHGHQPTSPAVVNQREPSSIISLHKVRGNVEGEQPARKSGEGRRVRMSCELAPLRFLGYLHRASDL